MCWISCLCGTHFSTIWMDQHYFCFVIIIHNLIVNVNRVWFSTVWFNLKIKYSKTNKILTNIYRQMYSRLNTFNCIFIHLSFLGSIRSGNRASEPGRPSSMDAETRPASGLTMKWDFIGDLNCGFWWEDNSERQSNQTSYISTSHIGCLSFMYFLIIHIRWNILCCCSKSDVHFKS